jgi:hypothetical protein
MLPPLIGRWWSIVVTSRSRATCRWVRDATVDAPRGPLMSRRVARACVYLGIAGTVLGLSKVHAASIADPP